MNKQKVLVHIFPSRWFQPCHNVVYCIKTQHRLYLIWNLAWNCQIHLDLRWNSPLLFSASSLWILPACSGDCRRECKETQRHPWTQPSTSWALPCSTRAAPSLPSVSGQSRPLEPRLKWTFKCYYGWISLLQLGLYRWHSFHQYLFSTLMD